MENSHTGVRSAVSTEERVLPFTLAPHPLPNPGLPFPTWLRVWRCLPLPTLQGPSPPGAPSGPVLPPGAPPSLSGLPALSVLGEGKEQAKSAVGSMGINAPHHMAWGQMFSKSNLERSPEQGASDFSPLTWVVRG